MKHWMRALRVPFSTATLIPVLLGVALAWHQTGALNWSFAFLTFFGVLFLQFGTNLANDYYDHTSKNDELNKNHNQFTGGSRVIQEGLIAPAQMLSASLLFFALGLIILFFLSWKLKNIVIFSLALSGFIIGFFYTASPIRIGYHRIGELITGITFGPLVVIGTYFVQTGVFSWIAFLASIPIGFLIIMILLITEFPDYEADKKVGKNTLVVVLGKKSAMTIFHGLIFLTFLYIIVLVSTNNFPWWTLLTLLSLPLAMKLYNISKLHHTKVKELLPAIGMTIGLHLSLGLLLSLGFVLDKTF